MIVKDQTVIQDGFFSSVSVIIPLLNETHSFAHVVETILKENAGVVGEIIVVVCGRTRPESLHVCKELIRKHGPILKIITQKLPFLGGALREGISAAQGSHLLVIFADGEADPFLASTLISEAKRNPGSIISASRWIKGGSFVDYPPIRKIVNLAAQKIISLLFGCRLTDYTFGYRIYPAACAKRSDWMEQSHAFVLESVLKPCKQRVPLREIPAVWRPRTEGKSQMSLLAYAVYLKTLVHCLTWRERP